MIPCLAPTNLLQYARTKTKTLRCFPCCPGVHYESSFCGDIVVVSGRIPYFESSHSNFVFCEIVPWNPELFRWHNSFEVGASVLLGDLESAPTFYVAKHLGRKTSRGEEVERFSFHPKRKWELGSVMPGRTKGNTLMDEWYCVLAYLVMDHTVQYLTPSVAFRACYQPTEDKLKRSAVLSDQTHYYKSKSVRLLDHAEPLDTGEEESSSDDWSRVLDMLIVDL